MKKDKYNIKFNQPEPTPEMVSKHKDFDSLLKSYNEKGPTPGVWSGRVRRIGLTSVITIAAALMLVYFNPDFLPQLRSSGPVVAERPYVDPPMETIQAKFASFEVDAYQGGTYEYESGSKIVVPPAAFIDFQGNPVVGTIQLEYREFHDPVDFFLSGIPMEYDSAGVRFNLESAGMMEIYAKQDGKRLNVKPGSEIAIQLVSAINTKGETPAFNIYKLDIENRNWVYWAPNRMEVVGGDDIDSSMQKLSEPELQLKSLESEFSQLLEEENARFEALELKIPAPLIPQQPRKANEKGFVFDLDINKDLYPDLAVYENVMWEVIDIPENAFFHKGLYEMHWDDAALNASSDNNYELTLTSTEQVISVMVTPVLTGSDYIKARDEFNQKYSVYQQEKAQRDNRVEKERKAIEAEMAAIKADLEARKKELEREIALLKKSGNFRALAETVMRKKVISRFTVDEMGVWNADRPLPIFQYNCNFTLVNREGQQYLDNAAYFLDKSLNTVHRFYTSSQNTIRFDERSNHLLWLVTSDGKIAVFRPEEFKKLERKPAHTLTMEVIDKTIESEEDIREILAL
ncbi:MAG: hypothetical protein AAF502_05660 [Bacteroidota bacterium]